MLLEATPLSDLLPCTGEHVHVLLGDALVEATVHAAPVGRLELALGAVPLNVRRSADVAAQVHWSTETGVCRLLGRLRMLWGHLDNGGVLVELTYAGTPQLLLRREHVRAELSVPIEFELASGTVRTRTINVSAGGLLVCGPIDVAEDQLVEVSFRLPGQRSAVRGVAWVMHITPDGDVGIALAVPAADQARLTLAVFDERRRQRH